MKTPKLTARNALIYYCHGMVKILLASPFIFVVVMSYLADGFYYAVGMFSLQVIIMLFVSLVFKGANMKVEYKDGEDA